MKRVTIVLIAISVCVSLLIVGCSKGPKNAMVIKDIKDHLIASPPSCPWWGNMSRIVHSVSIVGRQKKDDHIVIQAISKCTNGGNNCDGGGTFEYEVTAEYERFGKEWRIAEYGFDHRNKSKAVTTPDEDWSKATLFMLEMDTTGLARDQIDTKRKAVAEALWLHAEKDVPGNIVLGIEGSRYMLISSSGETEKLRESVRSLPGLPAVLFIGGGHAFNISSWQGIPKNATLLPVGLEMRVGQYPQPLAQQIIRFDADANARGSEGYNTVLLDLMGWEMYILSTSLTQAQILQRLGDTFGRPPDYYQPNMQWTLVNSRVSNK